MVVAAKAFDSLGWLAHLPSFLYETTFLVLVITLVIFAYLYHSKRPSFFVQLYLLSMAVKLIAYFAYTLIMILEDRPGAIMNVLYFLIIYILFTAIEITFLYKKISGDPKP